MIIKCPECKNDRELPDEEVKPGKWFECYSCGATYEITGIKEDGSPELKMIEEEK